MTTKGGKKVRLAFAKGTNRVIEAKNLETGATHTRAEFAAERRKRESARGSRGLRNVRSA